MEDEVVIAEARYIFAKSEAENVWRNHGGEKIPVCLNDIVKALGIETATMEFKPGTDGCSRVSSDGIITIFYNPKVSRARQRFTVAHEIGHIVLDHLPLHGSSSQLSSTCQEQEANAFAGELLLPIKHLKEFMKGKDKTIESILRTYDISKDVAISALRGNSRLFNLLKA